MYGIAAGSLGKREAHIPCFKCDDSPVEHVSWQGRPGFLAKTNFDYIEALEYAQLRSRRVDPRGEHDETIWLSHRG